MRNGLERGRRSNHVDVRHTEHDGDWNVYAEALKERRDQPSSSEKAETSIALMAASAARMSTM
jgi:hypothetical protein